MSIKLNRLKSTIAMLVFRLLFPQVLSGAQTIAFLPLAALDQDKESQAYLEALLHTPLLIVDPKSPTLKKLSLAGLLGSETLNIPKQMP